MTNEKVYSLLVSKAAKRGCAREEVDEMIRNGTPTGRK